MKKKNINHNAIVIIPSYESCSLKFLSNNNYINSSHEKNFVIIIISNEITLT